MHCRVAGGVGLYCEPARGLTLGELAMRSRWCASFVAVLAAGHGLALGAALDRVELLAPGISARSLCSYGASGHTCPTIGDPSQTDTNPYLDLVSGSILPGQHFDALGSWYAAFAGPGYNCAGFGARDAQVYRVLSSGAVESVATIHGCGPSLQASEISVDRVALDAVNGIALFEVSGNNFNPEIIEVSGLPALLDIILSYQPPSTLSFNVPVRPEGLSGADSFSMYAGDIRTASDLSQAFAMQCTVPAGRAPIPGEQLTVSDPLPDPAPGESRYYLAAVNYQGQRRAGRSAISGVLQGRNAAALPGCQ